MPEESLGVSEIVSRDKTTLLVVNDHHPKLFPGAATIALRMASDLNQFYDVSFCWVEERKYKSRLVIHPLNIDREESSLKINNNQSIRLCRFVNQLWTLLCFCYRLARRRPDIIWFHSLGVLIPRIAIFIAKQFQIKMVITIHDYTWLTQRKSKLYPEALVDGTDIDPLGCIPYSSAQRAKTKASSPQSLRTTLTLLYHRFIIHLIDEVICISNQQKSIYLANGFHIDNVIENYALPCNCSIQRNTTRAKVNILFAGRFIGKGLNLVIDLVLQDSKYHLDLAGPNELEVVARKSLGQHQFTYHGNLDENQLFSLFHNVEIVACLSQCYDVYPNIVLESLNHGTPVILTNTCGNFPIMENFIPESVLKHGQHPTPGLLDFIINSSRHFEGKLNELLPDKITIVEKLRKVLDRINNND